MRAFLGVLAMFAVVVAGGCASPNYVTPPPPATANAPYRLASGDRLRVIVFGQDNLSNSFSVDSAGMIAMPLIGRVRAQGLTTAELEPAIEGRLQRGYLRDPSVSVEVDAFRPFFALGEVGVAGQYPYISGMTVQNAVAVAGGFTPRAVEDCVDITRIIGDRSVTFPAPLSFLLSPGDTITVRERFF